MEIATCEPHPRESCGLGSDGSDLEVYSDQPVQIRGFLSYVGANCGPHGCVRRRRLIWKKGVQTWDRKSDTMTMRRIHMRQQSRRCLKCSVGPPDMRPTKGPCARWGPEDNDPRPRRPAVVQEELLAAPLKKPRMESGFFEAVAVRAPTIQRGGICLSPRPTLGVADFPRQRRPFWYVVRRVGLHYLPPMRPPGSSSA